MIRPSATIAPLNYNPFPPRAIRLCVGIIPCIRCDKHFLASDVQAGWGFQSCSANRVTMRGRCHADWWVLALPPDCFGGYLAATLGEHAADRIIRVCWPRITALAPRLWYEPLTDGDAPHWIQIAVSSRERHLYRTKRIAEFLPTLLRDAA